MKRIKYLVLAGLLCCLTGSGMRAEVKKVSAYIFGCGVSMLDSVAYVTDIQRLDSVILDGKAKFLRDRHLYSAQLDAYLEDSLGLMHVTTAVFYNKKKPKLEKTLKRVCKTQQARQMRLQTISNEKFCFHSELWERPEDNMTKAEKKAEQAAKRAAEKAEKKAAKANKKKR